MALLLLSGCLLPVRVVRISDSEMAASHHRQGREAELEGDDAKAIRHYRYACQYDGQLRPAWEGRLRLVRPEYRQPMLELLKEWQQREPEDPLPSYLLGRLEKGDASLTADQRAWQQAGGNYPPLLDPDSMEPQRLEGWRQYRNLLASLEPASHERDLRLLWTDIELGNYESVRHRAPKLNPGVAGESLLEAALFMEAGNSKAALDRVQETEPPIPEGQLLWVSALRAQGKFGEADTLLRRLRGDWGDHPSLDLFEAAGAAHVGRKRHAIELLESCLDSIVAPRHRIDGALLYLSLLDGARRVSGYKALQETILWAPSVKDLDRVEKVFREGGQTMSVVLCLRRKLELAAQHPGRESWEQQAELLAQLPPQVDAEVLGQGWKFLREQSPASRQAALNEMPRQLQEQLVRLSLRQADPVLRIVALRSVREHELIPFPELPAALAQDPDPRVRGAWLRIAADQGGEVARRAILTGRQDPDVYVREIADSLPLP
ncbi:MAG: hypothetical protein V3T77_08310 [Planctomycetota bacterium]